MNEQNTPEIYLQITEIAALLHLSSSTSLTNKARNQAWPHLKQSHKNGSPLHLYPLSRLPDEVQVAWASWDAAQIALAQRTEPDAPKLPPAPSLAQLRLAASWPQRNRYYQFHATKTLPRKTYDGASWGLCPAASLVLQRRLPDARQEMHADAPAAQVQGNQIEDFVFVPHYRIQASAGTGEEIESEQIINHLAFHQQWVRGNLKVAPKDLALINVMGDSMEPTLRHKDLILINRAEREVKDGLLYVLRVENNLIVKRLERLLNGLIRVKSDNPDYQEQLIDPKVETLDVIGRVLWFGREM